MSYFSNGSEGESWMRHNCYRCVHDHNFHPGGNDRDPCIHQLKLYIGEQDNTFIATPLTLTMPSGHVLETRTWTCVEFSRCPCDRGRDDPGVPLPPPVDPNQLELFDPDSVPAGVPADVYRDDTFQTAGATA